METTIKRTHYQNNTGITIARDAEGQKSRRIEGYAIRFDSPSVPFAEDQGARVVEYISPEAVTEEFLRNQDIKMTLYHDMRRLLARSKRGEGSLSYSVDSKGVKFVFDAPQTTDGDMALELVERGDIDGCSFMFSTYYGDREYVSRETRTGEDGKREIVYTVRKLTGLYDFTLTPDPAYPETSVSAAKRDISELENPSEEEEKAEGSEEKKEESADSEDELADPEEERDCEKEKEERQNPFCMDDYMKLIKLSTL